MASEAAAEAQVESGERGQALPLDLKIVAGLFVFIGAAALFGMIVGWFLDRASFDLTFLLALVGLGLLALRPVCRTLGLFFTALGLIGGVIAGLAIVIPGGPGPRFEFFGRPTPETPVAMAAFSVLWYGCGLWMLHVLKRDEVRALFRSAPETPRRLTRGDGVIVCLAVIAALLVNLAGLYAYRELELDQVLESTVREGRQVSVHYGHRGGLLAYVVFESTRDRVLRSAVGMDENAPVLRRPDGSEIGLPGEHLLYEIIDGKLLTSDELVTLEELEAFLCSSPEPYSIDALLSFAEQRRANASAAD